MYLVLSGNKDGRQITQKLHDKGYRILAATLTDYGRNLALASGASEAISGISSTDDLRQIMLAKKVVGVIDAGHPYPTPIQDSLFQLCQELDLLYLRYLREETKLPKCELIHVVDDWQQAAEVARNLGDIIFLTTGSHNLETLLTGLKGKRIIVRVLPDPDIISKCLEVGLSPKDIVAMQGPFSKAFNKATYKAVKAQVLISKDGGKTGGTDTKITAAIEIGIPVVLIKRPIINRPNTVTTYEEVEEFIEQNS